MQEDNISMQEDTNGVDTLTRHIINMQEGSDWALARH